jgi:hypothetical protein
MAKRADVIPVERIEGGIVLLRGQRVMLSTHLAELYEVQPKVLIQAVKRNITRFPEDFMFRCTREEGALLRLQIVTLKPGRYPKYPPCAVFAEPLRNFFRKKLS